MGFIGSPSKRKYVKICNGSIEFTDRFDEAGLYSKDEVVDVFVRLMGTCKRRYFIIEDEFPIYQQYPITKEVQS